MGNCTNTNGGYTCQCAQGYQNSNTSNKVTPCKDIDECNTKGYVCGDNTSAVCQNRNGTYNCNCKHGYYATFSGEKITLCQDIDECHNTSYNFENAACVNLVGGYYASCWNGYKSSSASSQFNFICEDIDECDTASDYECGNNGTGSCENTNGSYKCTCSDGFHANRTSDKVTLCIDKDECADPDYVCGNYQTGNCSNTIGSFECTCLPGFTQHRLLDRIIICEDLNECENDTYTCDGACKNSPGGWDCNCNHGYTRNTSHDGLHKSCSDINECESVHSWHCDDPQQTCLNTEGSYQCVCPSGYTMSADGSSCEIKQNLHTDCHDEASFDCATGDKLFEICKNVENARKVCPRYCGLCQDVSDGWEQWLPWGPCSVSCDVGMQTRTRSCSKRDVHGDRCIGDAHEYRLCQGNPCVYIDCSDLLTSGKQNTSGVYMITTRRTRAKIMVYCDMETSGGGWTVFQRRLDGSEDFNRNFEEYEYGFGRAYGEFWLGLRLVREMVGTGMYELRIDVETANGTTGYDVYEQFSVSDRPFYTLSVGNRTMSLGMSPAISMADVNKENGSSFSTKDIDRDQNQFSSCASSHQGGWWYNNCYSKNLNGKYVEPGTKGMHEGIIDLSFERADGESLKKTKMMIRRSF
ncbi:latent-transforming growth factor beta-binding protein 4-like isoform X2 [Mya arenaria]|uniref:latent-transforming growth factor beta-binding protein 4-like isoform X2 n=1 Tax=Mya arenaria TaxID=6604 RepID=UPI0022DF280C|nr:latent-transforming growth factor beta-binding protein 4-like isoform X2 [Mya arenaria]